ncbi:hypothetical protein [Sphingopyxis panaciterrulae]|uniref:Glycerophosphoryl diester phosphodiesterase membrane domain-containing protein n=1 Tax=Sphingopyxis panaciterrulae TaxID=462372 RepID=A0A7W9EQ21_9SPHN|nr:hypothetical protein [Sphingopyxis panaciterrulae]MBB5706152.1 hypothetical protein [Sphingopyxis panaciterrulae]
MIKMSIGAAFSETFAFLKANWTKMLMWMGGTIVVLGILGYLMLGSTFAAMAMATTTNDPSVMLGAFSRIFLFAILAAVILYAVGMLIWRGGLHPDEAPNFGWAFQAGPAFALGMFVVMAIAYIVMMIISFVLMLIFGAVLGGAGAFSPGAFQSGALSGGAMAVAFVYYVAVLVFFLWLQGRLSVAGPVMAQKLTRNPVTGITESWKLTGASQWAIVGFYILFTILMVVYAFIAGLIFGGITGALAGGSAVGAMVAMIVLGLIVYLPILMLSLSMPVGIYRAISSGTTSGEIFA